MANIINGTDTGSGGLITTGDSSDELQLQTAETTAVTIDSSQNVGAGVVPSAWASGVKALQVGANSYASTVDLNNGVTAWGSNYYNDGGNKFVSASSRYALQFLQDTTVGNQSWRVSNAAGTAGGAITWTTAMTLNSSGNLAFPNGQGIDFSASAGGGASSSILDDYEEGTWNGTVSAQTGTITTSTFSDGIYTKVGRLVTVSARLVINNAGTGSGSIRITLPFTPANNYWSGSGNENIVAGYTLAVFGTVNQLNIRKYDYATAIVNNHDLMFTATYAT